MAKRDKRQIKYRADESQVVNLDFVVLGRERVQALALANDFELAHAAEDALFQDVLHEIASGRLSLEKSILYASAALKSLRTTVFPRTCGPWSKDGVIKRHEGLHERHHNT